MSSPRLHDAFYQAGLSLLETLVAFTLLAGMVAVLIQVHARGALTSTQLQLTSEAIQWAESMLALTGSGAAATESGRTGNFNWHIRRTPYPLAAGSDGLLLQRVEIDVSWKILGRSRQLQLVSLRPLTTS